jgi:hypothetical protein
MAVLSDVFQSIIEEWDTTCMGPMPFFVEGCRTFVKETRKIDM